MQHKLKAVLHSSSQKKARSSAETPNQYHEANSPRSHNERSRSTSSSSTEGPMHTGRSRPLTSVYDSRRVSSATASQPAAVDYAQPKPSDSNGSIANDYRAYLPVLSSSDDSRNQEDVADRNINRYSTSIDAGQGKPLPMLPKAMNTGHDGPRNQDTLETHSTSAQPFGSTIRMVPSGVSAGKHGEGKNIPSEDVRARQNTSVKHRGELTGARTAARDGPRDRDDQQDWKSQQQALLDGVVDLRDTVHTDREVQMAPAVTHEIIKPHEHEVIQHKIYREIHNYSYYHRLQPVLHTEVLPPRHFIPNPRGEGLIEISADELPTRTGENRWWDIVAKQPPQPEDPYQWRTKPEVIEGKTYMTDEGFERKETTILHPPTLEDMSGYRGMIQPVHFDHKTGERWLGEVTTMDKLREEVDQVLDSDTMKFKELRESLPEIPPSPTIKRKPVDW